MSYLAGPSLSPVPATGPGRKQVLGTCVLHVFLPRSGGSFPRSLSPDAFSRSLCLGDLLVDPWVSFQVFMLLLGQLLCWLRQLPPEPGESLAWLSRGLCSSLT